jgi:hypothetical protein
MHSRPSLAACSHRQPLVIRKIRNAMVQAAAAAPRCDVEFHSVYSIDNSACQTFWCALLSRFRFDADPEEFPRALSRGGGGAAAQHVTPLRRSAVTTQATEVIIITGNMASGRGRVSSLKDISCRLLPTRFIACCRLSCQLLLQLLAHADAEAIHISGALARMTHCAID